MAQKSDFSREHIILRTLYLIPKQKSWLNDIS